MHDDLRGCIEAAKTARDGVIKGKMSVKEANSVASNNQTIIGAHAIDLRERIFLADAESRIAATQINVQPVKISSVPA